MRGSPSDRYDRHSFLQLAGALGMGAASLALIGAAPGEKQTLTLMTVGGTWGDSIRDMIAVPFAQKHNLELAFDNRPNAQQIAAIAAMRAKPNVDTVETGGPHLATAIALGLLDPLDPKRIPNYVKIAPEFKNKYYAARLSSPWVLTYSKTKTSRAEAEAQGWKLLLDPKLKGRVAVPAFAWQGEMWLNAVNLALGGTYENVDPGIGFARAVVRDNGGRIMENNDNGMTLFTSGELWAAPFWTGRTYELADKGVPLEFAYVKGWSPYTYGFVLLKGTPHKALVEEFIDYSLSPKVQFEIAKKFNYVPTLENAQVPADSPRLRLPASERRNASNVDYAQAAKFSDRNLERWNKEVLG